jgi:hypothetical protein
MIAMPASRQVTTGFLGAVGSSVSEIDTCQRGYGFCSTTLAGRAQQLVRAVCASEQIDPSVSSKSSQSS